MMTNSPDRVDVAIIGGGPAGTTVATLLARHGLSVKLFERQTFPRFHIGESLLPGSMPIFQELGVYEELDKQFIKKPGGKWYYGKYPVFSDFACGPSNTSFAKTPHAYMVKREELDQILLNNAARAGAQVLQQHSVIDLIQEAEKVIGVIVRNNQTGQSRECHCDMVFDCSGFGAIAAKKFKLRRPNRLRTMAVFGHYRTLPLDKDVKNGWIVAPMLYNGWVWMIPLKKDLVSVGAVVSLEEFQKIDKSPREFLESSMRNIPIVKNGLSSIPELQGKIHIYGNLGYTTSRASGDGWVLVGDAAFFVDPCYSSGVHLALSTAKKAVDIYLESRRTGQESSAAFAEKYEKFLREDEKLVLRLVDAFYMASRNRVLRWLIPFGNLPIVARRFVAVTGGDFAENSYAINMLYYMCKTVSFLFPVRAVG
jgi:flavin-dependent dehydrogenase